MILRNFFISYQIFINYHGKFHGKNCLSTVTSFTEKFPPLVLCVAAKKNSESLIRHSYECTKNSITIAKDSVSAISSVCLQLRIYTKIPCESPIPSMSATIRKERVVYKVKRGINDQCLSDERSNSHWFKNKNIHYRPMRVGPLFRQTLIVYASL